MYVLLTLFRLFIAGRASLFLDIISYHINTQRDNYCTTGTAPSPGKHTLAHQGIMQGYNGVVLQPLCPNNTPQWSVVVKISLTAFIDYN